ncbi:myb family transcription factor IPN2-like [Salvia hispanica]|uniref:myb family transcription factor IPN2-like n=1 Tax=Salvia hispanica TaxID=49212 RepID=UPI002009CACF|nr:myb family transcription factor IPN2-like [Salvia hispanica]
MATTRDPSGSSGWAATPSGAEDAVSEDENEHHPLELAPPHINLKTDSDFRLLSPKQRLRWTPEMHEKFIKAIAELGGRYKATPKSISKLMGVEGITLFHIKSHLQKFRLGKAGSKMRKKDFLPLNYYQKGDDILPPVNQRAEESSAPSEFNINGSNIAGAEAYGNIHLLVEAAAEKFETPEKISGQNLKEAASTAAGGSKSSEAVKPTLLSLFSTCKWPEYLHARSQNISLGSDNAPNLHLSAPQYHHP